ncbi:hypothetical protein G4228_012027 [Cervus hanglu yarkandensis]|nr:hypothetical protein G4228_012027 [Cervus hanglu yarkandensis]
MENGRFWATSFRPSHSSSSASSLYPGGSESSKYLARARMSSFPKLARATPLGQALVSNTAMLLSCGAWSGSNLHWRYSIPVRTTLSLSAWNRCSAVSVLSSTMPWSRPSLKRALNSSSLGPARWRRVSNAT